MRAHVVASVASVILIGSSLASAQPALSSPTTPVGRIVWATLVNGSGDIYVMEADGSGQHSLTSGPDHDGGPAWSPDGSKIAFYRNGQIWTMNADGSDLAQVTSPSGGGETDLNPSWSPDGTRIAFRRDFYHGGQFNSDVFTVNADGSYLANITQTEDINEVNPSWSPDGTKIAFSASRQFSWFDIYGINPDGTGRARITDCETSCLDPDWSPDGTRIAVVSDRGDISSGRLMTMDADGSHAEYLVSGHYLFEVSWSLDGARIAFSARRNFQQIMSIGADGQDLTVLTHIPADNYSPDWGPPA
jgi:Tol biopolymer transport system component